MPITLNNTCLKRDADKYLDIWKKLWSVRDTAWHLNHRHPTLVKYNDLLVGTDSECDKKRILFPLCGKNVDMKWYWDEGHPVIGVECAHQAINDFFSSNNIPFVTSVLNDSNEAQVFETVDRNLKIIKTNFLTLDSVSLNSKIDAVWDRGSFGTITLEEQILYVQTMKKLLAPDFRYLLLVLEFDMHKFEGPPFSISEKRVHQMFGEFCEIEKLDSSLPDHLQLYQKHMNQKLEVRETVYLLKDKRLVRDDNNNINE